MKKTHYLFPILLIAFLFFFCGKPIEKIDFCEILKRDQSHINNNKSDKDHHKDKATRIGILNENFDLLIQHIKQNGLPQIEDYTQDSCLNDALQITLIHTAQINQKKFFNKKNVLLLGSQIKEGKLDKEVLKRAIIVMLVTSKICKEYQNDILYGIEAWDLQNEIYNEKRLLDFVQQMKLTDC